MSEFFIGFFEGKPHAARDLFLLQDHTAFHFSEEIEDPFINAMAVVGKVVLLHQRLEFKKTEDVEIRLLFELAVGGHFGRFVALGMAFWKSPIAPMAVLDQKDFPMVSRFSQGDDPERFVLAYHI